MPKKQLLTRARALLRALNGSLTYLYEVLCTYIQGSPYTPYFKSRCAWIPLWPIFRIFDQKEFRQIFTLCANAQRVKNLKNKDTLNTSSFRIDINEPSFFLFFYSLVHKLVIFRKLLFGKKIPKTAIVI